MITTLLLLVMLLWIQSRMWFTFLTAVVDCWLMFNSLPTRISRSLSTRLLPSHTDSSLYWGLWLYHGKCRTLHFSLLNFIEFLLAHLSSLSRSLCKTPHSSDIFTSPPSLEPAPNLVKVISIPSSPPLMKMLNSVGPSIDPLVTPLMAGCQLE